MDRRGAIRVAACAIVALALGVTVSPTVAAVKPAAVISEVDLPVRVGGQLTVGFHGDPATGCASHGLCGYAGSVIWRPPRSGTLQIVVYRSGRKLVHEASLELQNQQPNGGVTTSLVQRAAGTGPTSGQCEDSSRTGNVLPLSIRAKSLYFTFARAFPALLATRCAGPLDADALRTLRPGRLALRAALSGSAAVDLSATAQFGANGLAGTTQSTLTLKLGKPHHARVRNHSPLSRGRYPEIDVSYRASLSGKVIERFDETGGPKICQPLDACGASGTIKLIPHATTSHAVISAIGPANLPFADLLAALGLSHHGHGKRVQVGGDPLHAARADPGCDQAGLADLYRLGTG